MIPQKVLVSKNDTTVIECPKCERRKSVPVGQYRGKKFLMKVKCSCSEVFEVELNFRKSYRKNTNLDGNYIKGSLGLKGHYDNLTVSQKKGPAVINCIVKDLSFNGIGLEIIGKHLIESGNILLITFQLDNAKKTTIQRKVKVVRLAGKLVGAEFIDSVAHDPDLGFYLMP